MNHLSEKFWNLLKNKKAKQKKQKLKKETYQKMCEKFVPPLVNDDAYSEKTHQN
jgi:hypothetical protein